MATITEAVSAEGRVRNMDNEKAIDCLKADMVFIMPKMLKNINEQDENVSMIKTMK